jgi:trans-2-enoyl-CoA reductase
MAQAQVLTQATGTDAQSPTLTIHNHELDAVGAAQVLIKFHAASINPLDIYVIKGLYPVKPQHHHHGEPILGFDGVGEVLQCGKTVDHLSCGDIVVPKDYGLGTWRSHAVLDASKVQRIPRPNNMALAAVLKLGVLPAYLLVEDLVALKPGDWVILNAATSVIAQYVVQFARRRGVRTIGVIRDRSAEEAECVKQALKTAGADLVLTETELAGDTLKNKRIVLALDSVFGSSGQLLLRNLSMGGTYVQLGVLGGSLGKVELSMGDLFARRLQLRGFRASAQWALRSTQEQLELLGWLVDLLNAGALVGPGLGLQTVAWDTRNVEESSKMIVDTVKRVESGAFGQRKVVMVFD